MSLRITGSAGLCPGSIADVGDALLFPFQSPLSRRAACELPHPPVTHARAPCSKAEATDEGGRPCGGDSRVGVCETVCASLRTEGWCVRPRLRAERLSSPTAPASPKFTVEAPIASRAQAPLCLSLCR